MTDWPDDYPQVDLYDRQGKRIDSWREWQRMVMDDNYRCVHLTIIHHPRYEHPLYVSTVWMKGIDFGVSQYLPGVEHTPVIFETMTFEGAPGVGHVVDHWAGRYSTEDTAVAGHMEIVASICRDVSDPEQFVSSVDVLPQELQIKRPEDGSA